MPGENFQNLQQNTRSIECLFDLVVDTMRLKLRGLTLTNDVFKASSIWGIHMSKHVYYREVLRDLQEIDYDIEV